MRGPQIRADTTDEVSMLSQIEIRWKPPPAFPVELTLLRSLRVESARFSSPPMLQHHDDSGKHRI